MNLTGDSLMADAAVAEAMDQENSTLLSNETLPVELLDMMPDPVVKLAHDILICALLISVMFAMGCHITLDEVSDQS